MSATTVLSRLTRARSNAEGLFFEISLACNRLSVDVVRWASNGQLPRKSGTLETTTQEVVQEVASHSPLIDSMIDSDIEDSDVCKKDREGKKGGQLAVCFSCVLPVRALTSRLPGFFIAGSKLGNST